MKQDKIELFVPGRLSLFGEHSDWAGQMRKFNSDIVPGQALVACTDEGIFASACLCETLKLRTVMPDGTAQTCEYPMEPAELRRVASEGGFFSYMAGVAAYISTYYSIGGLELDCHKMTLPQKKGLSSSAAVCVLIARAFNRLYGLNLTVRGEMEAAYHGEQLTPSRCGRLDQACAYGKGIVHMEFNGDLLDVSPVKVGAPLFFLFADLKAHKDTIAILRDLNAAYPYPRTEEHHNLHELLGKYNAGIIRSVRGAIADGDAVQVGALMKESQRQFDLYAAPLSPVELKSEKLHLVLNDPKLQQWIYGGKGVGSQGDGSIQFIAKSREDQQRLKAYLTGTYALDCYDITIPKTEIVRKAVVPVAGYGTRMYPATKMVKKEFFPIVDIDGYAKPALLIILDELLQSGIEEICLIIRPGEEDLYLSLFRQLPEENSKKLPDDLRSYEYSLSAIRDKIVFAYQEQMLGFGHAVLQSAGFSGGEPVLLILGDHLYRSDSSRSCFSQMMDAYEKTERLTIGLFEIPLQDAPKYGVVSGGHTDGDERLVKLNALVEKPTADYARAHLGVEGKQFAVFLYVLTPEVYNLLEKQYQDGKTEFGEFQLTPALDAVTRKQGAFGVVIDGKRFDIGLPEKYRATVADFGR